MATLPSTILTASLPQAEAYDDEIVEWVDAARSGDADAFARLVHHYQVRVWRLCGRFFTHRSDVEDAAQDTFVRCWEKLHTYRRESPFEHWLTRVCLNICYQKLRREKNTRTQEEPFPTSPPDLESAMRSEHDRSDTARIDVERVLGWLPPVDRFLLVLLEGLGLSTAEAAEQLGWTRVNVKVRAHRARRRLRSRLEAEARRHQ